MKRGKMLVFLGTFVMFISGFQYAIDKSLGWDSVISLMIGGCVAVLGLRVDALEDK